MYSSNLIELLRTFTPQEMRDLGDVVRSPFFNKNQNVIRLFEIIADVYPNLERESSDGVLEKPRVFAALFPDREFNDSTLRLLIYYLYEAAKSYLSIRGYEERAEAADMLMAEMQRRGLIKEMGRLIREEERRLETVTVLDAEHYRRCYQLEFRKLDHGFLSNTTRIERFYTKNNIESTLDNLTNYYLSRALPFHVFVLNCNRIYNTAIDFSRFNELLQTLAEHSTDAPIVRIYHHTVRMLLEPEVEDHFFRLKEELMAGHTSLAAEVVSDIVINLENYCVRKDRQGETGFREELFSICLFELEHEYYLENGHMPEGFYLSAVMTARNIKRLEWAREFIESYRSRLHPSEAASLYHYCSAWVDESEKNFARASEHLAKVNGGSVRLRMEARMLQAVLYYEMRIDEPLLYLIDTLKHYFRDERVLSKEIRSYHADSLRYIERLCDLRDRPNARKLTALRAELDDHTNLYNHDWLMKKIEDLEAGALRQSDPRPPARSTSHRVRAVNTPDGTRIERMKTDS